MEASPGTDAPGMARTSEAPPRDDEALVELIG
jgi:hypothetical protein